MVIQVAVFKRTGRRGLVPKLAVALVDSEQKAVPPCQADRLGALSVVADRSGQPALPGLGLLAPAHSVATT